jgi:predicted transcriptional regulator
MEVLWDKGSASVADVVAALPKSLSLHYSTVLTTLRILETKGYLRHKQDGRAFIYEPVVVRDQARKSAVTHLLRRFFDGSPELLVLNLMESNNLRADDLRRLRQKLEHES